MSDVSDLDRLEKLLSEATPGEWTSSREDMNSFTENDEGEWIPIAYIYRDPEERIGVPGDQFRNDARLIVAAKNALPALIAELRRRRAADGENELLRKQNSIMRDELERMVRGYDHCNDAHKYNNGACRVCNAQDALDQCRELEAARLQEVPRAE